MRVSATLLRLAGSMSFLALGASLSGCALTREELELPVRHGSNPAHGPAVSIVRVSDVRQFELQPHEPSTPSLKYGEIGEKSITSRAFARKHDAFTALGDILLPRGRTVAQVVEETVTRVFQERGYRVVVGNAEPDAIPVEIDIDRFWAWSAPGFSEVTVEFSSSLLVRAPLAGFDSSENFAGRSRIRCQIANEDAWVEVMAKGLEDLAENLAWKIPTAVSEKSE